MLSSDLSVPALPRGKYPIFPLAEWWALLRRTDTVAALLYPRDMPDNPLPDMVASSPSKNVRCTPAGRRSRQSVVTLCPQALSTSGNQTSQPLPPVGPIPSTVRSRYPALLPSIARRPSIDCTETSTVPSMLCVISLPSSDNLYTRCREHPKMLAAVRTGIQPIPLLKLKVCIVLLSPMPSPSDSQVVGDAPKPIQMHPAITRDV